MDFLPDKKKKCCSPPGSSIRALPALFPLHFRHISLVEWLGCMPSLGYTGNCERLLPEKGGGGKPFEKFGPGGPFPWEDQNYCDSPA